MARVMLANLFIICISAYSEFSTTCTIPPTETNYVSSPNTRGTLDILWSCFFTIVACTWTIQHLNVPEQRGLRDPGLLGDAKWLARGIWTNAKWMLATMIAPEYILGKALADLQAAHLSAVHMRPFASRDGVEWGLTQAFLANMGGFVLVQKRGREVIGEEKVQHASPAPGLREFEEGIEESNDEQDRFQQTACAKGTEEKGGPIIVRIPTHQSSEPKVKKENQDDIDPLPLWRTHTPSLPSRTAISTPHSVTLPYDKAAPRSRQDPAEARPDASGLVKDNIWGSEILRRQTDVWMYSSPFHLLASEIYDLRRSDILPRLPDVSKEFINDKSKGDVLIKLIAVFQVFWFVLQVIGRSVDGLNVSQLELAVTAFAVCAILTYLLLLKKPKGVQIPLPLMEFDDAIPISQFQDLHHRHLQGYLRGLFAPGEGIVNRVQVMGTPIPNDALQPSAAVIYLHVGVALGGVIFGSVHIAAWDFEFPTYADQILWRVASISSTVVLPIMYLVLLLNEYYFVTSKRGQLSQKFIKIWDMFWGGLYLLARMVLLVEIFRTLFYLPPEAYLTSWPASIPHVG